jgi:hypothetical protein
MSSPLTSLSSLEDILDITPASPNSPALHAPPVPSQADADVWAIAQVGCRTQNVSVTSDLHPIISKFHSAIVQITDSARHKSYYAEWRREAYGR